MNHDEKLATLDKAVSDLSARIDTILTLLQTKGVTVKSDSDAIKATEATTTEIQKAEQLKIQSMPQPTLKEPIRIVTTSGKTTLT